MMLLLFRKRFDELSAQLNIVESSRQTEYSKRWGSYENVDSELLLNWCVKVRNLLSRSCGEGSQHFTKFVEAENTSGIAGTYKRLKKVRAVFLAAKEDFEGGYVTSVRNLVQAETFDSELEQASELLGAGYGSAAAVIAGAVLETALRDLCEANGLAHGKIDKMNADLVKAGVLNKLTQKRITAWADIRNNAAHGKPEAFGKTDVESMISDVGHFVSDILSP